MADRSEIEQKILDALKEQKSVLEESKTFLDKTLQANARKLEIQKAIKDITQNELELTQERLSEIEKEESKLERKLQIFKQDEELAISLLAKAKDRLQIIKDTLKEIEKKEKLGEKITEQEEEQRDLLKEEFYDLKLQIPRFKERLEFTKENYQLTVRQNAALKTAKSHMGKIGSSIGLALNVNKTWLGKLQQSSEAAGGMGNIIRQYPAQFKETFAPANIFASLMSKTAQSTLFWAVQTDSALASMNKATGAGGRFNSQIIETGRNNLDFGVGLMESAEAFQALHMRMSMFTSATPAAQAAAAQTTARLIGLGISSETTAQSFDILTRAMGMSVTQSNKVIESMANFSDQIGVAPAKLMNDFVATAPALMAHGPRMSAVFKDLAKQSKATGIEMQALIGIAQQFDTFEGAAQAAGKLNAVLGGNLLNSVQLLNADEATRIKLLRQSVQASGRSFDSMSRFEKMAVASAAGIRDMNEAARIFGKTDIEFRKMQREQKTLQERAAAAASAMDKLKLVTQAFAVALEGPIWLMNKVADAFLSLNDGLRTGIGWILSLGTALIVLKAKFGITIPFLKMFSKAGAEATETVGKGAAGAIESVGKAGAKAGPGLMQLGGGMFTVAASIALVAAGIAVAVAAVAMLVDSITNFFGVIVANMDKLPELASNLGMLTAVMLQMVFVGMGFGAVAVAFGAFTLGILSIAGALALIKTDDLVALGNVAKSLDGMTIEKSIAMKGAMEGFEMAVKAAATITPETVENTSMFVEKVSVMQQAALAATVARSPAATTAAASGGREIISGPQNVSGQGGQREVVLKVNERELARAVVNILESEMKLNKVGAS